MNTPEYLSFLCTYFLSDFLSGVQIYNRTYFVEKITGDKDISKQYSHLYWTHYVDSNSGKRLMYKRLRQVTTIKET
jgi:hypothetical protein